ncbi:MAG: HAMP domain-containing protein [Candidatus Omnitrophota bacterium]
MRFGVVTKNPLQFKYLTLIMASIIIPLFFVAGCLYYLIFQIMAEQLAIPEFIAQNLLPVLHKINLLLIIGLPPIIILLFIWGASLTHRMIGPLERLENDLKKISKGDYSVRLQLRKNDDLKPIASVLNDIIEKLKKCDQKDQ